MIPKIRFSEFVEEWKKVKLSECLEISKERNLNNFYGKNDVLSVSDELGVMNQIELLGRSFAGQSVTNYNVLRTNQIVYTKSPLKAKPYGIVKVNKVENGIVSVLYAVYNAKDGISSDYIHYYFTPSFRLNNYLHPLVNKGAKNTMNISDEDALKGEITIPPTLSEQRRISQFFTLLDETIRLEGERLASLKQVKAASLQSFFPQEGEKEPRVRFKGFSGEWKKVRLGDCGFTYSGIGFPEKEQGGQSGIPFYKVSDMNNIGNEHIMISSNNYVSKKQIEENHWNVCKSLPAIFFAKVGAAVLLDRKRLVVEPCICDNNTMMYCLDTKIWDKYFCLKCFENIRLSALIQVGTLPSYNASTIESIEVFIPSLAEQRALSSYFTNIDEQIRLVSEKIEKMKKVKGACLEGMMV